MKLFCKQAKGLRDTGHRFHDNCPADAAPESHHDLRHLFATRCIESGVDIPPVSRWLGHKDGGALAMKTYGHLRVQRSVEMAEKVRFSKAQPDNVVPMPDHKKGLLTANAIPIWLSRRGVARFCARISLPMSRAALNC